MDQSRPGQSRAERRTVVGGLNESGYYQGQEVVAVDGPKDDAWNCLGTVSVPLAVHIFLVVQSIFKYYPTISGRALPRAVLSEYDAILVFSKTATRPLDHKSAESEDMAIRNARP
jgi:hypothetical protein